MERKYIQNIFNSKCEEKLVNHQYYYFAYYHEDEFKPLYIPGNLFRSIEDDILH